MQIFLFEVLTSDPIQFIHLFSVSVVYILCVAFFSL